MLHQGASEITLTQMIILVQVWLGRNKMPAQFAAWRETWIAMHPGWKHLLWTEDEADQLPMLDRQAYDSAQNGEERRACAAVAALAVQSPCKAKVACPGPRCVQSFWTKIFP